MADSRVNLVGEVFGELLVQRRVHTVTKSGNKSPKWEVLCSCGKKDYATTYQLRSKDPRKEMCECCARERERVAPQDKGFRTEFNNYRNNAKGRNLEFSLTIEDVKKILELPCHYCGTEPQVRGRHNVPMNGIDRVDNSVGYVLTNIVPCCKMCNMMKKGHSEKDFLHHIKKIYHFNKGG